MRGDLQEGYFALLDANFLSSWCQFPFSRAQNRGFCAFLAFRTPVFRHFEHEIGIFVLFLPSEPPFSGISSTKSRFLCAFTLRDPRFQAFRAQNRGFCALLRSGTPVFGRFEHRNGIFVSETAIFPWFWLFPSTKSRFLCFFALRNPRFRAFRAQNRGFCALFAFETPVFGLFEHKIGVFVRGFCILAEIFELGRGGARRGIGKSNN